MSLQEKDSQIKGPDMRVNLCGVELASPVIAASGTFGYGVEFDEIVAFQRLGRICEQGALV